MFLSSFEIYRNQLNCGEASASYAQPLKSIMKIIKLIIIPLFPVCLYGQGIFIQENKSCIMLSSSISESFNSEISTQSKLLSITLGRKIDVGIAFSTLDNLDKDEPIKAVSVGLTFYPSRKINTKPVIFGFDLLYTSYRKMPLEILSAGIIFAYDNELYTFFSIVPVVGLHLSFETSKFLSPEYNASIGIPLKFSITNKLIFILEFGGGLSTLLNYYGGSTGLIFSF